MCVGAAFGGGSHIGANMSHDKVRDAIEQGFYGSGIFRLQAVELLLCRLGSLLAVALIFAGMEALMFERQNTRPKVCAWRACFGLAWKWH
jgi:hypothetical protein